MANLRYYLIFAVFKLSGLKNLFKAPVHPVFRSNPSSCFPHHSYPLILLIAKQLNSIVKVNCIIVEHHIPQCKLWNPCTINELITINISGQSDLGNNAVDRYSTIQQNKTREVFEAMTNPKQAIKRIQMLQEQFVTKSNIDYLNRAIQLAEQMVTRNKATNTLQTLQSLLCNSLALRFNLTGVVDDVNKALRAIPLDHPIRARGIMSLYGHAVARFQRSGVMGDLGKAIEVTEQVVAETAPNDPGRVMRLDNLGSMFYTRYERLGALADIEKAIQVSGQAVKGLPKAHPARPGMLSKHGDCLFGRFELSRDVADLDKAYTGGCGGGSHGEAGRPITPQHLFHHGQLQ